MPVICEPCPRSKEHYELLSNPRSPTVRLLLSSLCLVNRGLFMLQVEARQFCTGFGR